MKNTSQKKSENILFIAGILKNISIKNRQVAVSLFILVIVLVLVLILVKENIAKAGTQGETSQNAEIPGDQRVINIAKEVADAKVAPYKPINCG